MVRVILASFALSIRCLLQSIAISITRRFFIDSGLLFFSIVFSYPPDIMTILDLHGFIQKRTNNTLVFFFSFFRSIAKNKST